MWRRPALTLIIVFVMPTILARPLRAQQKTVAPRLRPARADVAASLSRHGGGPIESAQVPSPLRHASVAPTFRSAHADLKVSATTPSTNPAKPFTQDQVSKMVQAGLGDNSGAKLIEQRGIDFAPSDDFLQTLKTAGASEAFLNALRTAKPPEPASAKKPINQVQVFALLVGQVPGHRVSMLVQERGIDFEPTEDYLQEVRLAGGEDELISALNNAKVTKPARVDPAVQARQAEVRQHAARGAEYFQKREYAQAEQEYRAALLFDPHNSDLYDSLAQMLMVQNKWDDSASAAREAIRLNPDDDYAHYCLAMELGVKDDPDGEVAEYRAALRLNPDNFGAYFNLGVVLLGQGDWDGEIALERQRLHLIPDDARAHANLGVALEKKGERRSALEEYHAAYVLDPKNAAYKQNYERLQQVNH